MSTPALRGLYALVAAPGGDSAALLARSAALLAGGARLVQYRDETVDAARREREARALLGLCHQHGALLIINDDVGLAARVGADGVHLGRDDTPIEVARLALGPHAVIGASCYDSLERAGDAAAAGADYVAFGSVFPSTTKPAAVRVSPGLLATARTRVMRPVCAIGGITPDNAAAVVAAGADLVAVQGALQEAADPRAAAARIAALFTPAG
jgi:thiamine-phosphate pyrophosphorylase